MWPTGGGEGGRRVEGKSRWFGANTAYAPAGEVLIEGLSVQKHANHIGNAADIPVADILIEANFVLKHLSHIGNAAGAASSGVAHVNITGRPFGIFDSTYCTGIAICGIGTENGNAVGMEGKEQFTVISTYSIYWRVARVTADAALYIIGALRAALAWRAVGAGIDGTSSSAASTTTAGAVRKAKERDREQDREGVENMGKAADTMDKNMLCMFFTI